MSKKTSPEPARAKQKRLSPEDRRKEFVAKATEFFSEEGFGGGTRDLARRLGVTQPLLYRYFPSKDDLIKEVYRTVYLEPLDTGWEKLLADRSRPIRHRLQEFYSAYTDAIFTRKWLRIYLYSGLKGLDINRWYVGVARDKILTRIIRECRHEAGLPVQTKPTASELEMAWVFHGGIFYSAIDDARKHPRRIAGAGVALRYVAAPRPAVRENLRLGLVASPEKKREVELIEGIARIFPRLAERLDQEAVTMSGGEQQMLAIARAMISKPDLIMLDEPSEGIMPVLVDEMFELFRTMKAQGTTILLVEQNVELALDIADRAYVLDQGAVVHHASARELLADNDIKERYCSV
jgi:ABC-type branched-subunit amino acid transport system ATPase component